MFEVSLLSTRDGILYTEYPRRSDLGPLLISSWSFESIELEENYRPFEQLADGRTRVRILRTNPLLQVMLPEGGVGLVLNLGDRCRIGALTRAPGRVPRYFVVGPLTHPVRVRLGRTVRALGMIADATLCETLLGVRAAALVDRITPLERYLGEWLPGFLAGADERSLGESASALQQLIPRKFVQTRLDEVVQATALSIRAAQGAIRIAELAAAQRVTRQYLGRAFREVTGFAPKEYARLVRFGALLRATLLRGPKDWASAAASLKLSDQAHLIREFRTYAGASPRRFLSQE